MKIGFIYRGDPRHRTANRLSMLKNIAAAKRLGHEVVLITPRTGMNAREAAKALEGALDDFGIAEKFPIKPLPRLAFKGRVKRSFDMLAAAWARSQKFDMVWSREFYAAYYASALGITTILEHHHPFTERQRRVGRRMLRRAAFRGVAAISEVHRGMLLRDGWPADRVLTAHSGVDLEQFDSSSRTRVEAATITDGRPVVLYAGSLYAGKGGEQILRAAERLRDVSFVCIGGRDFEVAELNRRIASLCLDNIELKGSVKHAQIPSYLFAADVLIAPYTQDGADISGKVIIPFASPIKLFEYMAAGKPIVTSRIGAIPEILRHEVNALLVTPGSVDELVASIERLLRDPRFAAQLGAAARKDVRHFSWDERVARVLEFACGRNGDSL